MPVVNAASVFEVGYQDGGAYSAAGPTYGATVPMQCLVSDWNKTLGSKSDEVAAICEDNGTLVITGKTGQITFTAYVGTGGFTWDALHQHFVKFLYSEDGVLSDKTVETVITDVGVVITQGRAQTQRVTARIIDPTS